MGNRERILWADDMLYLLEDDILKKIEEDGHEIVGRATSVAEVKQLIEDGVEPTVAILDASMPSTGDGERAAAIIRGNLPSTKIVSFSVFRQSWGDKNWEKGMRTDEILESIRNL